MSGILRRQAALLQKGGMIDPHQSQIRGNSAELLGLKMRRTDNG
jgi:hypothetical protein